MDFFEAVKSAFSKYGTTAGRSSRPEYWYFWLFVIIGIIVSLIIDAQIAGSSVKEIVTTKKVYYGPVTNIFYLATLAPQAAVSVRRLHDVDRSGWWLLLIFTIIGLIPFYYWMCKKGDEGENRFGPDPSSSASATPQDMLRRLYGWTMGLGERPGAMWALAAVAFVESSVFPIPPDVLLIPMVLAARAKWWRMAALCTAASVLGGLAGYAIGAFLFDAVGHPVLEFYGQTGSFEAFRESYNQWGAWIVGGAGLTPFPYKVITIASGATGLDLGIFMAASVASRGLRFFLEAWLLWYIGPPVRHFVEKNLGLAFTAFLAALLGGFVVVRYVF